MENWFHVIMLIEPRNVFGFASENDVVTKAPVNYEWMLNKTLKEVKPYFLNNKCIIAKVC